LLITCHFLYADVMNIAYLHINTNLNILRAKFAFFTLFSRSVCCSTYDQDDSGEDEDRSTLHGVCIGLASFEK
jgi:hypothetical protein